MLEISHLSRHFEGVRAVDDVSLSVARGETVSLIGPNGAGKTTLFNLVSGLDRPTAGVILFDNHPIQNLPPDHMARYGIARTFQLGRVFANLSVLDNVLIGAHARRAAARAYNPLVGMLQEVWNGLVAPAGTRHQEREIRAEAEAILAQFGDRLTPRLNDPAYSLSYANRRRVEIARALALAPRLLLLDEPTAGMNLSETAEMLDLLTALKQRGQTMLLIEHKLELVMQLSDRVIVMDNGRVIAEGTPHVVRDDPRVIEAYLGHGFGANGIARG